MSLGDWLGRIGPMLILRIPIIGRRFGKPRVDIGAHAPPDQDALDRMRKAEGKAKGFEESR